MNLLTSNIMLNKIFECIHFQIFESFIDVTCIYFLPYTINHLLYASIEFIIFEILIDFSCILHCVCFFNTYLKGRVSFSNQHLIPS